MKKILRSTIAMLLAIITFASCTNDDSSIEQKVESKTSITSKLAQYREIAKYHSEGLEYAYDHLLGPNKTRTEVDLAEMNCNQRFELIKKVTNDYIATKDFPSDLIVTSTTRSDTDFIPFSEVRPEVREFIDYIEQFLLNVDSGNTISENVNELMSSLNNNDYFNSLSEIDQQAFMMYIVVFEDSYLYWVNNVNSWPAGEQQTRFNPNDLKRWWNRNRYVVRADAVGGIAGTIGGFVGGVVGGAIAGTLICPGLGTVAGALYVGGVAGITTGVGTSVTNSIISGINGNGGNRLVGPEEDKDELDYEKRTYLPSDFGKTKEINNSLNLEL